MTWERADQATIDNSADYLVQTNGNEWRDQDRFVWPGIRVRHMMRPEIVRGRPVWIAKVTEPPHD